MIGGQYQIEGDLFEKEIRRKPKLKNPDKEIEIELKNTELVCKFINHIICDNVISKTVSFDEEGIISFISALCEVSKQELNQFFNPRIFSLHKLIEVADFNILRIQIEWVKIWKLLSDHIVYITKTYNHDNICIDAIDSLRQIVIKLLQKQDLTYFNFQIDFFRPFEIIFNQSINRPDRSELILNCITYLIHNSKNIRSGWIVIFSILKNCLKRKDKKLNEELLKILTIIQSENILQSFPNHEIFKSYIECLCHMFLEENMKSLAYDIIVESMSKIFNQTYYYGDKAENKYELLKIMFYGFDELIKYNVREYFNLLNEILNESKKMIFGADASNFLFIYYSYIKPQLIMAVLMKYENRLENLNISIEDYSTKNEMIESNKSFIEFSNINSDEKDKHYNKIYNNTLLYLQQSLEITKNNLEKIKESKEE